MEPRLTTSALVLHNLGIAAGFGGTLFGRLSLEPAVGVIEDPLERGRVLDAAWQRYKWVNAASLGAVALTWFAGRTKLSGRELGKNGRRLTIAKDIFVGTNVVATLVNVVAGMVLHQHEAGAIPLDRNRTVTPEASAQAKKLQPLLRIFGTVNLVAAAGVIVLTSWLNNKASSSFRWNFLSRLLP